MSQQLDDLLNTLKAQHPESLHKVLLENTRQRINSNKKLAAFSSFVRFHQCEPQLEFLSFGEHQPQFTVKAAGTEVTIEYLEFTYSDRISDNQQFKKIILSQIKNKENKVNKNPSNKPWLIVDFSNCPEHSKRLNSFFEEENFASTVFSRILLLGQNKGDVADDSLYEFPRKISNAGNLLFAIAVLPITGFGFYLIYFGFDKWNSDRLSSSLFTTVGGSLFALLGTFFFLHQLKRCFKKTVI